MGSRACTGQGVGQQSSGRNEGERGGGRGLRRTGKRHVNVQPMWQACPPLEQQRHRVCLLTSDRGSRLNAWKPKWRPTRCTTWQRGRWEKRLAGEVVGAGGAVGNATVAGPNLRSSMPALGRSGAATCGGSNRQAGAHRVDRCLPACLIARHLQNKTAVSVAAAVSGRQHRLALPPGLRGVQGNAGGAPTACSFTQRAHIEQGRGPGPGLSRVRWGGAPRGWRRRHSRSAFESPVSMDWLRSLHSKTEHLRQGAGQGNFRCGGNRLSCAAEWISKLPQSRQHASYRLQALSLVCISGHAGARLQLPINETYKFRGTAPLDRAPH